MKKILIIDDDADVLDLLGERLWKNGYAIETANDGVEGMARIKDYQPDLVILDVMMPHMDGYTLFQNLKFDLGLKGIPILVLTGRKDLKDLFENREKTNFLTKPFNSEELLSKIKKCLRGKKSYVSKKKIGIQY